MSFLRAIWKGPSKHKKLSEDFVLSKVDDPALEGVSFDVKYLGSTLVETPSGEGATAEAIKTVITMAKASGKKLQRVTLSIGLHGIRVVDVATEEIHLEVSIYRISYCSADAAYDHVFAFIATNSNETMECHAFLCSKRKIAQAVTLTVAQSFNMAYEFWQMSQQQQQGSSGLNKSLPAKTDTSNEDDSVHHAEVTNNKLPSSRSHSLLIDFSAAETPTSDPVPSWVCFEDDEFENMNSSFARLAASRISSSSSSGMLSSSTSNKAGPSSSSSSSTNPAVVVALSPPPRPTPLDNTIRLPRPNAWSSGTPSTDLLCS